VTSTAPKLNSPTIIPATDFSKRLSALKQKDPQILQKAANLARNNYK
jgi:hypothetical protein